MGRGRCPDANFIYSFNFSVLQTIFILISPMMLKKLFMHVQWFREINKKHILVHVLSICKYNIISIQYVYCIIFLSSSIKSVPCITDNCWKKIFKLLMTYSLNNSPCVKQQIFYSMKNERNDLLANDGKQWIIIPKRVKDNIYSKQTVTLHNKHPSFVLDSPSR